MPRLRRYRVERRLSGFGSEEIRVCHLRRGGYGDGAAGVAFGADGRGRAQTAREVSTGGAVMVTKGLWGGPLGPPHNASMNRNEMYRRVRAHPQRWDIIVVGGGATGVG